MPLILSYLEEREELPIERFRSAYLPFDEMPSRLHFLPHRVLVLSKHIRFRSIGQIAAQIKSAFTLVVSNHSTNSS